MAISGRFNVAKNSLNLRLMLEGGQCFRWSKLEQNKWIGVASKIVWVLTQHENHLEYLARSTRNIDSSFCQQFLTKYLRLQEDLTSLYRQWSEADEHFAHVALSNPGLRILDQEPLENLFSFICSSNNNIVRISSMVEKMCKLYGEKVLEDKEKIYYSFPTLEKLADEDVESNLRAAGFGYRAKYIHRSAVKLLELGGEKWLTSLTQLPYSEAKQNLVQLDGVGPKVADCICLMSLGHLCSVPVDTHVFQIAAQHYLPHLRAAKSCTPKIYSDITNYFVQLYGQYAGWAHSILFCSDLKMFKKDEERKGSNKKSSHSSQIPPVLKKPSQEQCETHCNVKKRLKKQKGIDKINSEMELFVGDAITTSKRRKITNFPNKNNDTEVIELNCSNGNGVTVSEEHAIGKIRSKGRYPSRK